jgi:putative Holliday junction resolvase
MGAQTYLGFDYGTKYLGIAVGSSTSGQSEPLATAAVRHGVPDWQVLDRLIKEWQPHALVVGLPLNMDDSENEMTRAARKFGHRLQGRYNLPVHWVDERLTSIAAKHTLTEAGIPPRRQKARMDRLAARHILQAFLDEGRQPAKEARHGANE